MACPPPKWPEAWQEEWREYNKNLSPEERKELIRDFNKAKLKFHKRALAKKKADLPYIFAIGAIGLVFFIVFMIGRYI